MWDGGRKPDIHLSSLNCLGPYYRVSPDKKAVIGRANFEAVESRDVQIKLTDIYGCYDLSEIIPIDRVGEIINPGKKIPVRNCTVYLKSLLKEYDETWTLDYSVQDSAGNRVDAAIDAGIYMKAGNYRMPATFFRWFKDAPGGDRRLVMRWNAGESEGSLIRGPAIKITRPGIRLEEAVADINLGSLKEHPDNRDEKAIMAAVNEYYNTMNNALTKNGVATFEKKYGYL